MAMVLNRQRQAVLVNHRFTEFAGAVGIDELCGFRPGEILRCTHAAEAPNGCGTTESCSVCGALRAIVTAQLGRAQTQICRVERRTAKQVEPLELEISAAPIEIGGEPFTIVCATDISERLRREWLEHTAVPQALELALEMEVLSASLASATTPPRGSESATASIAAASRRIASIIREHSELAAAETGSLQAARCGVAALEVLRATAVEFEFHEAAKGHQIRLAPDSTDATIDTDPALAGHVIAKILLNALEASPASGVVTVGCRTAGGRAELWVHNDGVIPRAVQLQMFHRSFSTKGRGRGYGTYFAKLITERYLGGAVAFRSGQEEGTTFSVFLPLACCL
jgi:signal transduction histidine kinase